ncbi:MAG: threonine aldolase family protein [Phycisphaerae bacterium]
MRPTVDLRSDTVTQPTPEMREAIANARVGDDVWGDDPTVTRLEERTAELLGKQAAVYMPSGTMTNQVAIRVHTQPGDEVLIADNAHIYWYECGAPAAISGVLTRMLPTDRGVFTGDDVRAAVREENIHHATQRLVCLENTSNRGGGRCWPIEAVRGVAEAADEHSLRLHLDGARIWNAAVAQGRSVAELVEPFDTVSVCFSKGLGAPVGSCLAGDEALMARARRFRKMLGGGMRQAGIIAAGALFALDHHLERLTEDHANARRLAEALQDLPGIYLNAYEVETNIVLFDVDSMPAEQLVDRLAGKDVLVGATGKQQVRAVTNLMVDSAMIDRAIQAFREVLR